MARFKKNQYIPPQAPLLYEDHGRPVTRRQFIRQGMMTGSATVLSAGAFGMFANPNMARAAVAPDLDALATDIGCILGGVGAGQSVPFIAFDLAGGANFAGSNVLVGQGGGQMDLLSTAGYSKLGLPGDMLPGQDSTGVTLLNTSANNDFTNNDLNLVFHADSPMLFGILEKASTAIGNVDGAVIPARSDNDTGNNPHNPLYPLAMAGARGSVVDLIGSRSSVSGGNSMAPAMYIDPNFQPTKVDRPSDVTGLVDVGDLTTILGPDDVTAVMESITRITHKKLKLGTIDTGLTNDDVVKDLVRCGYLKASDIADRFAGVEVDPTLDTNIAGPIFSATELANDGEFRKTASVMKMVMNGYAAGGCITMGGYDYHTGDRRVGENRDLRAGRCIGACLEYARLLASPLMIYVFSDGSVASNGNTDDTASAGAGENLVLGGGGKGEWTGDNSSTACSFFLVFDPTAAPTLVGTRQIGRMNAGASVVTSATPAANNVNLLVNMVILNYMAVNGQVSPGNTTAFTNIFPNHGLGNQANLDSFISFGSLV
ncbi:MAG: general secretion pathway protein GspF [Gammaproteobacteria bacterium]|nr:general secretion pathway protein GspF [Gammaproteobacteria bacterium]MDH3856536.1 general secretion pathway protein GspF [Gammaproteobacteria bacterium]